MQLEQGRGLLKQMLEAKAEFRDGQWEAIDLVANQRQRVLLVQRTGWGKSVVYFLATKALRDGGAGPALLISPLLSLMRNQILAAERLGIRATTIHSQNVGEWEQVESELKTNRVDLLMVSPERLGNEEFLQKLLPVIRGGIGMFVVDEAHCISDWGHDFRPDYRRIVRLLRILPAKVPVLCTTATANNRVVQDIESQIPHLHILRGPLVRRSLKLYNIRLDHQAERLAWLAHFVPKLPGNGIIYTLTIEDARRVAEWLKANGIVARAYHAELEAAERIEAEEQLLRNRLKALVATVALGMGYDKPDLGFVVHFQRPGSVVAYYQQVGRAGRAVATAYGILLSGREDEEIQQYFINSAFPPLDVLTDTLKVLEAGSTLTLEQIAAELNYRRGALEKALKLLEVEGAVQHQRDGYSRTANVWQPDTARFEQVTKLRYAELEEMKRYVEHRGCLMEFLARALDDPSAARCGNCMNCSGHTERQSAPATLVQAASDYLRGDTLLLKPRQRWPRPVLLDLQQAMPQAVERFEGRRPKSAIPDGLKPEEGRVLCIYGDAGWGQEVARSKYGAGRFSDALVDAAAELIRSQWNPQPPPEWVVAIPSQRTPTRLEELARRLAAGLGASLAPQLQSTLVEDLARRLAACLGLRFVPLLRRVRKTPPQKEMQNSAMQLRNVLRAFEVAAAEAPGATRRQLPPVPVLLVDDIVDSGWTLTVAAVMLRQHGIRPVYPFALARSSPREG